MIASGKFPAVRILLDYRPALRQRTGVGEYVHQAAGALVATASPGESLVLFSSSWKDRLRPDVVSGASTVDVRVPVKALNLLWHRAEWPPLEWFGAGKPDIIQAAHPLLIPSGNAASIVTVHDLDFLDHADRTKGEIRRDYASLAASHARRADQVIVVSRHTAAEVERRLGTPQSRISVCSPGRPPWAPREAEPEREGVILFLGTLEPRKNISVLVEAYERLIARWPEAPPLVLAGSVSPALDALVARVRRPPFAGRVHVTGYVEAEDRLAWYRRALVFVLPSHTEGFGMTAVEAMTVGTPVIAASRGALPEVVGEAGRLVDPDDAEGLSRTLEQVLGDAALRRRMRDEGLRQVEQYSWRNTAARMREAWARALEHRAARRG